MIRISLFPLIAAFVGLCLAWNTQAEVGPAAQPTLLALSQDAFLTGVLYHKPGRLMKLSDIAPSGAVSLNGEWENHKRQDWFIEEQRYGADLVQAGTMVHDNALIEQGLKVLQWGFGHEAADGSFPGTGDPHHSVSFFLEATSRAWLLLQDAGD